MQGLRLPASECYRAYKHCVRARLCVCVYVHAGEDQSHRKDIPLTFDAVWDVLGSAAEVTGYVLAMELVSQANTASEAVLAR